MPEKNYFPMDRMGEGGRRETRPLKYACRRHIFIAEKKGVASVYRETYRSRIISGFCSETFYIEEKNKNPKVSVALGSIYIQRDIKSNRMHLT